MITTEINITVTTTDNESGFRHNKLIDEVQKLVRKDYFDTANFSVSTECTHEQTTEAEIRLMTEDADEDRRHRSAISTVMEAVNNRHFQFRTISYNTIVGEDFDPEELGEVSETDPEDHKVGGTTGADLE